MRATTTLQELFCRDCAATTGFEAVPCVDGHLECCEVTCVECGAALLVGIPLDTGGDEVRVASVA